ncbi:hypothetical protein [Methylobacterium gregans]|uniref:hypothetical protein n=1 Tax=Methylobacterium gregans TaxID=374424 RepID=UPI00360B5A98
MADSKRIVDALVRARRGGLAAGAALGGLALVGSIAWHALRGPPPRRRRYRISGTSPRTRRG